MIAILVDVLLPQPVVSLASQGLPLLPLLTPEETRTMQQWPAPSRLPALPWLSTLLQYLPPQPPLSYVTLPAQTLLIPMVPLVTSAYMASAPSSTPVCTPPEPVTTVDAPSAGCCQLGQPYCSFGKRGCWLCSLSTSAQCFEMRTWSPPSGLYCTKTRWSWLLTAASGPTRPATMLSLSVLHWS